MYSLIFSNEIVAAVRFDEKLCVDMAVGAKTNSCVHSQSAVTSAKGAAFFLWLKAITLDACACIVGTQRSLMEKK